VIRAAESQNRTQFSCRPGSVLLIAVIATVSLVVGVSIASAGKSAEAALGGDQGTTGGLFDNPVDVAVDHGTGRIFAVDEGNNRIQRFSSGGEFERAWGRGVTAPGGSGDAGGANEQQTLTIDASGGTYLLRFTPTNPGIDPMQSTPPIPFDAASLEVQSALETLGYVESGDIAVSGSAGGPYTVEFAGRYAATDVAQMNVDDAELTGSTPDAAVETTVPAAPEFEICTVASECRRGATGVAGGELTRPSQLAFNQSTDRLYVSDDNHRVTEFDADGSFVRAWGADVVEPGGVGHSSANEVKKVAFIENTVAKATGGSFSLIVEGENTGASGNGDLTSGSTAVTNVSTSSGAFAVGEGISGPAIPSGTTLTAVGAGTLTLSKAATATSPGSSLVATDIPYTATTGEVEAALEALPGVEPGDAVVGGEDGGPWEIEFAGPFANAPVNLVVEDANLLGPFGEAEAYVETPMAAGGFEVCSVADECKEGASYGSGAGQFGGVSPLAVGPSGHIFLGDASNGRVQQFEPDGTFIRAWGWGVDSGAEVFEICTAASRCGKARPNPVNGSGRTINNPVGQFARASDAAPPVAPRQIAVDADGIVYAGNVDNKPTGALGTTISGPPRIERFDSTESSPAELLLPSPIHAIEPAAGTPGPLTGIGPFEVDPSSGNLYVLRGTEVDEIDTAGAGSLADTHFAGNPDQLDQGLGYDEGTDRLFASTIVRERDRVVIGGATGMGLPQVVLDDPEVTGDTSVVFSGQVTPDGPTGIDTLYHFQYRTVGDASWLSLPTEMESVGDGPGLVEVEHAVSTLQLGASYEVRLRARKEFGVAAVVTAAKLFSTGEQPPTVETLAPQRRGHDSAVLVGRIDSKNLDASYHFEWGEDVTYGNLAPVPKGVVNSADLQSVAVEVSGLQPETVYHYRLVADNGIEAAPGLTEVPGDDVQFTTRAAPTSAPPARAWEMVTPPFKLPRTVVTPGAGNGANANPGVPSLDGEALLWQNMFFPLDEEVGYPASGDHRLITRSPDGWQHETLNTVELTEAGTDKNLLQQDAIASSADLLTQPVVTIKGSYDTGGLLPTSGTTPNRYYTRRPGTGTLGYTPWLTNPDGQFPGLPSAPGDLTYSTSGERALVDDRGTAMVRSGSYYDLADDPLTVLDEDPTDEAHGGVYMQRAADPSDLPSVPKEVVNACTGSGGSATEVPARLGDGSPSDTIGAQNCAAGGVLSAELGGGGHLMLYGGGDGDGPDSGPITSALSDTGTRVFLTSPKPGGGSLSACTSATGAATFCPPQLFVRQLDSSGENPRLSWISRSRSVAGPGNSYSGPPIASQEVGLLGPVGFQGASRDGRVVYFKTNSPLTPDDPNGSGTPGPKTAGTASNSSWDLYRYELPEDLDGDPHAGSLSRISGGPSGTADPATNNSDTLSQTRPGSGGALRYLSADGDRAFFVTTSAIESADASPPAEGKTTPGGTVGNAETRNLYLFDAGESGADRYRFIARLPFATSGSASDPGALNHCASFMSIPGYQVGTGSVGPSLSQSRNCFRGTPDGSHVVFFTGGQLTEDDTDAAGDIYLYDVAADRLTRVSAPAAGAGPYPCNFQNGNTTASFCNADLGFGPGGYFTGLVGGPGNSVRGFAGTRYNNLAVDENGVVSVYFESRAELLAEDQNSDHWDVYEWREGELSLISRAASKRHSYYSGNSLDGEDVFIFTSDRIDPREIDDFDYDIYDARVDGGFPYVPPPEPCDVLALECEGAAIAAPPVRAGGSVSAPSSGNVTPKKTRCPKPKVRRGNRCVKRRAAARKRCNQGRPKAKRRCVKKRRAAARKRCNQGRPKAKRQCAKKQRGKSTRRGNGNRGAKR
jgi:hypothetical protein